MERPNGIVFSAALMGIAPLLAIVDGFTMQLPPGFERKVTTFSGAGALIVGAIQACVILAFYNGQNWARWVVLMASPLYLGAAIRAIRLWPDKQLAAVLLLLKGSIAFYLLIYLNSPDIREWFANSTRATRASRGA